MNDTAITTEEKASGRSKVPSQSMKNSFSVNNDMIYFKDELLKEMKKLNSNYPTNLLNILQI